LTVGGIGLARSKPADEEVTLGEPLRWADVQRQFERADRRASGSRPDQLETTQKEQIPGGDAPGP
jgi:hypothetical protein